MKKTILTSVKIICIFPILINMSIAQKEWTSKANFIDFDNSRITHIYLTKDKSIIITNPKGLAKYDANGNNLWTHESEGAKLKSYFSKVKNDKRGEGIKIGSMKTEMPDANNIRKVFYLPLKSGNFLEFNFDKSKQSLALIEGSNGNVKWELKEQSVWNYEDFRIINDDIFDLMKELSTVEEPIISPAEFINKSTENRIIEITETNRLILDAKNGLISLNLENGKIDWKLEKNKGQLQALLYDEKSKTLIAAYGIDLGASMNTLVSKSMGKKPLNISAQADKFIMRIDVNSGEIKWDSEYNGNLRRKTNGFGNPLIEGVIDIRLHKNVVMVNSLNIEFFDFETGEKLLQPEVMTKEGVNAIDLFMTNNEHLLTFNSDFFNMDVFPIEINDIFYYVTNKYGVKNLSPNSDQTIRAYDTKSKKLLWETELLPQPEDGGKMTAFTVTDNYVIAGFPDGRGVVIFDKVNGKKVWQYTLKSKGFFNLPNASGVSAPFLIDNHLLYVAEYKNIHVLNLNKQAADTVFSTTNKTGVIRNMEMTANGLLIKGKHILQTKNSLPERIKGLSLYNKNNYELIETINVSSSGEIIEGYNNYAIIPVYPSQNVMFVDKSKFEVIGKKGNEKYRNAIIALPDEGVIYTVTTPHHLKKGRVHKFKLID